MNSKPSIAATPAPLDDYDYSNLPKNVLEQIFAFLSPRELAISSAVCCPWRNTAELAPWQNFHHTRWPTTSRIIYEATTTSSWHKIFSSRMSLARSFGRGRPQLDYLASHSSGVKVAKVLPQWGDVMLTGSVDRKLMLWDLESGTQIAASSLHAGTVRCLAVDEELLVTGSSDHRIRVWRRKPSTSSTNKNEEEEETEFSSSSSSAAAAALPKNDEETSTAYDHHHHQHRLGKIHEEFPFHLEGAREVLPGGHSGPVSALEICSTALFSGSWDYCVRVWDRTGNNSSSNGEEDEQGGGGGGGGFVGNNNNIYNINTSDWPPLQTIQVLHFDDWITSMCFKSNRLFVAAGSEAHVLDAGSGGSELRKLFSIQRGGEGNSNNTSSITAVQCSEDGNYVFCSSADGAVFATDLRAPSTKLSTNISAASSSSLFSSSSRSSSMHRSHYPRPVEPGYACSSAVTGLSWDYPWLAASLQNGEVLLINAEVSLLGGYPMYPKLVSKRSSRQNGSNFGASNTSSSMLKREEEAWPSRALSAGVPGGAQCVDLAGRWLVAGYEGGSSIVWDFSKAEEAERAANALRRGRKKERERRREAAKISSSSSSSLSFKARDGATAATAVESLPPRLPAPISLPRGNGGTSSPLVGNSNNNNSISMNRLNNEDGGGNNGGGRETWQVMRRSSSQGDLPPPPSPLPSSAVLPTISPPLPLETEKEV